jgi:hypothetical protein
MTDEQNANGLFLTVVVVMTKDAIPLKPKKPPTNVYANVNQISSDSDLEKLLFLSSQNWLSR